MSKFFNVFENKSDHLESEISAKAELLSVPVRQQLEAVRQDVFSSVEDPQEKYHFDSL